MQQGDLVLMGQSIFSRGVPDARVVLECPTCLRPVIYLVQSLWGANQRCVDANWSAFIARGVDPVDGPRFFLKFPLDAGTMFAERFMSANQW
jgi:hypothetical protein